MIQTLYYAKRKNTESKNMARPGITYNDVANAAQQLAAQGKIPTIELIRLLTGTGSNTTIAQHLKTWKHRQTQAPAFNSEGLPQEITSGVQGLWDEMLRQSDQKIIEIKQELEQTIEALQDQNKKWEEKNRDLQQQYHQMKQEKEKLASDNDVFQQIVRKFENEKIALMAENQNMNNQLHEKQMHLDELRRLNQQVQANLEHYHEASREQRMRDQQRHEQTEIQLAQTINQLQQELSVLNQKRNGLQREIELIQYTKTSLQDQHDQLSLQYEAIKSQLEQTQHELIQRTQAEHYWQNQYQKCDDKLNKQNVELISLQSQHAVQAQKLSDTQDELKEVTAQIKFLTNERWVLGQENAQLMGQLKQFEKLYHISKASSEA